MPNTTSENFTSLSINLPLPIDVVNTLMMAIAMLYPNSTFGGNSNARELQINIPDSDRLKNTVAKVNEVLEGVEAVEGDPTESFQVTQMTPNDIGFTGIQDIANSFIPFIERTFEETGAENYVEFRFNNPETRQGYHLVIQRTDKLSPAELREEAEARAQKAERELAEHLTKHAPIESYEELLKAESGTIVTTAENNVLIINEGYALAIGSTSPIMDGTIGYSAPYKVLRKGR